ncbi:hypothetical protein [Arthrobacter sp. A5]|uniref:hypothetical protein n=1 Tax=Arthrobacter sp. A5 TaxID=576926 RepID=UPI003DA7AC5C
MPSPYPPLIDIKVIRELFGPTSYTRDTANARKQSVQEGHDKVISWRSSLRA